MRISESVSGYKHADLGNIKLAFTQICKDELFTDVYFAANALYFVVSGAAIIHTRQGKVNAKKGEAILIRQHSKIDIEKQKDTNGDDFKSIIFYLFPDFVDEFLKTKRPIKFSSGLTADVIQLKDSQLFRNFCMSLISLFDNKHDRVALKNKTFDALHILVQQDMDFTNFLAENSAPIKIDLYEFMIHNIFSNYSIDEFAKLTGRSISAFKRDFKTIFNITPHQWLLGQRLDYAEKILRTKTMKASDIYLMVGFNELSHFSAAFKKRKGFSPSQLSA
ncbi:MAG TPA: AraC family transcriptional regulator [Puia sp.]|jgi:AraC-like DNA-binding protein|nr:AraC family transcriptional regulator [Puia sp.]